MLKSLALFLFILMNSMVPAIGDAGDSPSSMKPKLQTFALETYVQRAYNYLDRMVDKNSLPYFNIFWREPAEAAHDWPDFGDVTSRQLQAAIMARRVTGVEARHEKTWLKKVLSYLDPETGLLIRPKTSFSEPVADLGDQTLTLYALVTAYADHPDETLKAAIIKMVKHLPDRLEKADAGVRGFMIKSLMVCARQLPYPFAADLAAKQVDFVFNQKPLFSPDNTFRHGGHMHMNLRTLVGAADYALHAGDPILYSRVDALYRYVRSEATRFGFLPEVIGRRGDVVSCETCALMDYLGIAVTLANHGHPEYWGDVERTVRNQMVESQVADAAWLKDGAQTEDTDQFSRRAIGDRMIGGYAGWTSPTHILAAQEELHWGGPELRGKTRAFQNCCGGSGTHAFYIVWKNAACFENGVLSVNLLIDKQLPQAEIRSYQPYKGLLKVALKESGKVRVRIPEFVEPKEMRARSDRGEVKSRVWGNYLEMEDRQAGEQLEIAYPLPIRTEEVAIGNPDFRQYRYRVTWKGDTVVKMEALGDNVESGYSDFDKKNVAIYYGNEGPGRLYQRDYMLPDGEPELSPLQSDDGRLNFWRLR